MGRTGLRYLAIVSMIWIAACDGSPADISSPTPIFPDLEKPGAFNRMYTFTENQEGTLRVWTQEQGDATWLYESRKRNDGNWSDPVQLNAFPNQGMLTEPSFSAYDGYLYYASNAVLPSRGKGQDPNIWRVEPTKNGWGTPEPLSHAINTGAAELGPVMDREGRLYFTTDFKRGRFGHDVVEAHWDEATEDWIVQPMPDAFNSFRADAQIGITPDGNRIFFYSHRTPKVGFVDIWTAQRDSEGNWQAPENMGEPVNTPGPDLGPSVSLDGETFYFSRDGQLMQMPLHQALSGVGWTGAETD